MLLGLKYNNVLFGPELRLLGPVSDADIGRALRDLRAAAELDSFRLWLVGSGLTQGRRDRMSMLCSRPGPVPCSALISSNTRCGTAASMDCVAPLPPASSIPVFASAAPRWRWSRLGRMT